MRHKESVLIDLGHDLIINENLDYKESELRKIVYPIDSVPKIGIEKKHSLNQRTQN